MSCINIVSNSSGLVTSRNSKESNREEGNIKIVDNWEFKYTGQENPSSVNLQEIRYYESLDYSQNKQERQFLDKKFKNKARYQHRQCIEEELVEEYPQFGQLQLKFLTSVIFIQRKWRQYRLYKDVFENIAASANKKSQLDFEQSNSMQLNISNTKSPHKSATKKSIDLSSQKDKSNRESRGSS